VGMRNPHNPWLSTLEVEEIFSRHIEKPEN
jgi:hypothetical protein